MQHGVEWRRPNTAVCTFTSTTVHTRKIERSVKRMKFYKHEIYRHLHVNIFVRSTDWTALHGVCLKTFSFWEASRQSNGEMYQMVTQSAPYRYGTISKRSLPTSRQTTPHHKVLCPTHLSHSCPCMTIDITSYWYGSNWSARNNLRILSWDTRPTDVREISLKIPHVSLPTAAILAPYRSAWR